MNTISTGKQSALVEFPPELVQEIFHYGAQISTTFCVTLCSVSKWTRTLALPHLYATVIVGGLRKSAKFVAALREPPSDLVLKLGSHPGLAVHNLLIEAVSNAVVFIFRTCDNLTHIALHSDNLLWLFHSSSAQGTFLISSDDIARKPDLDLTITTIAKGADWSGARFVNPNTPTSPLFSKITRIRLPVVDTYAGNVTISHFPRLTHLAIPFCFPTHDLSQLPVMEHPSLEVLVVVIVADLVKDVDRLRLEDWIKEINRREQSLRVTLVESDSLRWKGGWENEVRGGKSIWDAAAV